MHEGELGVLTKFLTVLLHKSQDNEEVYALYWQDLLDQFYEDKSPQPQTGLAAPRYSSIERLESTLTRLGV